MISAIRRKRLKHRKAISVEILLFPLFYLGVPAFWIRREPPFANTLALFLDFKN